jgi:hypothetical protein
MTTLFRAFPGIIALLILAGLIYALTRWAA